jgi:calcium uniporter protein, mitochondrial
LKNEIKMVANDYDVEWDEAHDEKDEAVTRALDEVDAGSKSEKRRKKDSEKDEG